MVDSTHARSLPDLRKLAGRNQTIADVAGAVTKGCAKSLGADMLQHAPEEFALVASGVTVISVLTVSILSTKNVASNHYLYVC